VRLSHFSLLMLTAIENECLTENGGCDPLSTCTPSVGGHACGACPAGYSGDGAAGCTDVDECATNNGGCDAHAACTNTAGGYTCGACPTGYSGDGATGCTDIDECATNNGGCDPLTACTNTDGSRTCSACPSGYSGDGAVGCTDIDECLVDNGGCGDASLFHCQNGIGAAVTCSCIEGAARPSVGSCGLNDAGTAWQTCGSGDWRDRCFSFSDLGAGECRQGDGNYSLAFDITYYDLAPHTSGNNASEANLRCEQACVRHSDWCKAIQLVSRDDWPQPECQLITDRATFEGAGNSLQNDSWGGIQVIDGANYQTYCGGTGDCTHTNWNGGSLYARAGYQCSVMAEL
jgi:hypothetical protein